MHKHKLILHVYTYVSLSVLVDKLLDEWGYIHKKDDILALKASYIANVFLSKHIYTTFVSTNKICVHVIYLCYKCVNALEMI